MFAQNKFEETNNLIEEDSGENQSLFNDIIIDLLKRNKIMRFQLTKF